MTARSAAAPSGQSTATQYPSPALRRARGLKASPVSPGNATAAAESGGARSAAITTSTAPAGQVASPASRVRKGSSSASRCSPSGNADMASTERRQSAPSANRSGRAWPLTVSPWRRNKGKASATTLRALKGTSCPK